MLVQTYSLYGGLNYIIFRFVDLLLFVRGIISYFSSFSSPVQRMASSYYGVTFATSSWLHQRLERRFASIISNCFLIVVGWLD